MSARVVSAVLFFFAGIAVCELVSCGAGTGTGFPPHTPSGAWVSSGGEVFKDANNPWFVKNTQRVRYCVKVSEAEISASPEKIDRLFQSALAYWKAQFFRYLQVPAKYDLGIAEQEFTRVECSTSPDLEILAGYGALSSEQQAYLKSPERLVSVAVRTAYDSVSLRGRGFLFLSSDRGQHRMDVRANLVEGAWQYDGLLLRVLTHELGHLFGIPHVSNGILSAQYPEYILLQSTYRQFLGIDDIPGFFLPPDKGYLNCEVSPKASGWFGLARGECLYFKPPLEGLPPFKVEFFALAGPGKPMRRVGIGTWYWDHASSVEVSRGVTVYLPPEQKVFDPAAFSDREQLFLFGALFVSTEYQLNYRSEGSDESRALYVKTSASGYELSTIDAGETDQLLYYNPSCPHQALAGIHSLRTCLTP